MKPPPARARPISAASRLKREIETAEAGGVARESMTLRLTHGDVGQLRRDRTLAVEDISFADGEMRYLGVAVVAGGVAESALTWPPAEAAAE